MSVDMGLPSKQNVVQMPSQLNAYCRSYSVTNSGVSLKWMFVFWAGQVAVVPSVSGGGGHTVGSKEGYVLGSKEQIA